VQKAMIAVMVLPPSLVFVGWLSLLGIAGITGRHPIWSITPENLPEAAAFGDPVAVIQHLARGEPIDRAAHVRTGMGRPDGSSVTPIEAAAAASNETMVDMLFNLGAMPDAAVWQRAWCASETASVRDALERGRPPGVVPALCP
jgi:hypothetical protein